MKMKTRYKILITIIVILSVGVLLLEIFDNFFNDLIHEMKKDNAVENYYLIETTCNDSTGKPDAECFTNAFDECKLATIKHMGSTVEGDPIFYYATIIPDDLCQIKLEKDISQDKWKGIATKGLIQKTCTDVLLEESRMKFQCHDGNHIIYLR